MAPNITVDSMRDKLHSVDYLRELLSQTEPVSSASFPVGGSVRFNLRPGWNHEIDAKPDSEPVDASVRVGTGGGAHEYQLTKGSLLEATSIIGLSKGYAMKNPAQLVEAPLNYWYREGFPLTKMFKLLVVGDQVNAFTKDTIQPFSNLAILDRALDAVEGRYGRDVRNAVLVDYKLTHTLPMTHFRLIIPENLRTITGTGIEDDVWSTGIQIRNSLTGVGKTAIEAYLFRWWCTNGAIDTHASSGEWSRRGGGQDPDEVYSWAQAAVEEVLGGLEPAFDDIQALTEIPVSGDVRFILGDLFEQYRIPTPAREAITNNMIELGGDLTMYTIMQAITAAANGPEMTPGHADQVMRMGGHVGHASGTRCSLGRLHPDAHLPESPADPSMN